MMVMLLVYYLKFLFCIRGIFADAHFSDNIQQYWYQHEKTYRNHLDNLAKNGMQRQLIANMSQSLTEGAFSSTYEQNFQELDNNNVAQNNNEYDEDGKPKKRLVDELFHGTDTDKFRQSPALSVLLNTNREAYFMVFFLGLIAMSLLSYTYVVFFIIFWGVQLAYRLFQEHSYAKVPMAKFSKHFIPFRFAKTVWATTLGFSLFMAAVIYFLAPSYTEKDTVAIQLNEQEIERLNTIINQKDETITQLDTELAQTNEELRQALENTKRAEIASWVSMGDELLACADLLPNVKGHGNMKEIKRAKLSILLRAKAAYQQAYTLGDAESYSKIKEATQKYEAAYNR